MITLVVLASAAALGAYLLVFGLCIAASNGDRIAHLDNAPPLAADPVDMLADDLMAIADAVREDPKMRAAVDDVIAQCDAMLWELERPVDGAL